MKIVAIVQARIGSSRLNAKVLKPLGGTTVIEFLVSRLKKSSLIDEIIIATSNEDRDDQIESLFQQKDVQVFRGSEHDVLDRYFSAAEQASADIIVRVTGDCPLVDPSLVDDCINKIKNSDLDYVSNCNCVEHPLPDGFDVEVFTMKSFKLVKKMSITKAFKEHVTFGYFQTGLFKIDNIQYENHSYSDLRLTIDYIEDYEVISEIVKKMNNPDLDWKGICKLINSNKEIIEGNSHIERNASWGKSFEEDNSNLSSNFLKRDDAIANSSGLLSKRADQFSPGLWPKNYIKAKGQVIWAENNKLFLDYSIGGIGATTLGYAFNEVDEQVINAINNGSATSLNSALELKATKKLIDAIPWIESVRYTRSGGEATTLAIRLARAHTKKVKVLFSGYHGWHDWYLSSAYSNKLGNHLLDNLPISGVPKELADTSFPFDYGDIKQFKSLINQHNNEIGAVILEPMRYTPPDKDFLENVRKICSEKNIVMIFDEISSGFRFNNNVVHLDVNVIPDITVLSKALGNGYPIACIAGKKEVMESSRDSFISSTTHTESVGFAAMSAVLDYYRENDVSKMLKEKGLSIKNILTKTASKFEIDIKIIGMDQLWSWSFDVDPNQNRKLQTIVTEQMLSNSILFSNRFYATLGIDEDFNKIFETAITKAFKKIHKIINEKENPEKYIKHGVNRLGIYS